jgi:hypothetical protein
MRGTKDHVNPEEVERFVAELRSRLFTHAWRVLEAPKAKVWRGYKLLSLGVRVAPHTYVVT